MLLYRICRPKYANDLSGTGAKLYGGRWNPKGVPLLYCSENSSLAMLEILVNAQPVYLKQKFSLVIILVPDKYEANALNLNLLNEDWAHPTKVEYTKQLGQEWAIKNQLLLKVPSAVNPFNFNYLLNPLCAKFKDVEILGTQEIYFDWRLTQGVTVL